MKSEKIRNLLQEYADKNGYELFEVEYHRNDQTLSIVFDEEFDMAALEAVSQEVSDLLDPYEDEFDDHYFLDVSTVGIERPIRNEQEVEAAIGQYVYVRTKDEEYYGDLLSYAEGMIQLQIKDKTRVKDVSLAYAEVREMRYAVRF
ncbi:MAG: hypothetical protein IJL85_00950 [Erysipelotrichaceae bacterium]|nr:hypothetical protein [Erysipelotrichaceae bacterium]